MNQLWAFGWPFLLFCGRWLDWWPGRTWPGITWGNMDWRNSTWLRHNRDARSQARAHTLKRPEVKKSHDASEAETSSYAAQVTRRNNPPPKPPSTLPSPRSHVTRHWIPSITNKTIYWNCYVKVLKVCNYLTVDSKTCSEKGPLSSRHTQVRCVVLSSSQVVTF